MKPRPRKAENRIAEELNKAFSNYRITPFERIPVLGRTGPDLTVNELGLIIDVKSRKACPKKAFSEQNWWYAIERKIAGERQPGVLVGIRVSDIGTAVDYPAPVSLITMAGWRTKLVSAGKQIWAWWEHMYEWKKEHHKGGITAIVIHKPGMPYGNSMLIMRPSGFQALHHITRELKIYNN